MEHSTDRSLGEQTTDAWLAHLGHATADEILAHDLVEHAVDADDPRIESLERYVGTYTNHLSGEVYAVPSRDCLEFIRVAFAWGSQAADDDEADGPVHFAVTYARRVVENVIDHTPAPAPNQYLAWGGEAEGYTIVTVDKIIKDLAQESASGWRMWTRCALIGPRGRIELDRRAEQ